MITLSERPMNLFKIEFEELYQRHLCRHSQFGVNVIHCMTLFGIWYAFAGILYWLLPISWLFILGSACFILVAFNLPPQLSLATFLLAMGLCGVIYYAPLPWEWGYVILVLLFNQLQTESHRIYSHERDVAEFRRKYPPGALLYSILMLYELPLVLNYLFFCRQDLS
ncbi:MAG: hypothetical protein AAF215_28810 [Cyanobacteria bacterium P01_A01_bin.123]